MALMFLGPLGEGELVVKGGHLTGGQVQRLADTAALVQRARQESERIVHDAQREARRVLEQAREDAQRLRQEALREGEREATARAQAELGQLLVDTYARANAHLRQLQPALAQAVVRAVAALVGQADPAASLVSALEQVKRQLPDADSWVLKVAPDSAEHARQAVQRLNERSESPLPLHVDIDPSLPPGRSIIESSLGHADVELDEQLQRLELALRKSLEDGDEDDSR